MFFTPSWIFPNYNFNTLVIIPNTSNVNFINLFRPISFAKFKFKFIYDVLALSSIIPTIISKDQNEFIQRRSIKDCIGLTSEALNLMILLR